jgi:hypothetical protein
MLLSEKRSKRSDAIGIRDIQLMILDFSKTAMGSKSLCFFELGIVLNIVERLFSSCFIAGCKVYKEWTVIML